LHRVSSKKICLLIRQLSFLVGSLFPLSEPSTRKMIFNKVMITTDVITLASAPTLAQAKMGGFRGIGREG
jgi:hypothetical protein